MLDDAIAGYRFSDLVDAGILKSRTDLARKQKKSGFPMPVKLGKRQAWFPKAEVQRLAERTDRRAPPTAA